jgi:hypothetical protein
LIRRTVQSDSIIALSQCGKSRLEKVLAQLAANIATKVHSAERIPKRSEVRDSLKLLKGEARRFEKALSKISLLDISFSAIDAFALHARPPEMSPRYATRLCPTSH